MRRDDDSPVGKAAELRDPPRLTEESGVDPWLVGLVRSTGPYRSPPGRKQRVLLSLGRSDGARRPPLVLRPALAAAVLIGCGAFASAAIGPWRGWVGRAYERLAPSSTRVAVGPERARTHRLVAGHAETLATDSPPVAAMAPAESPSPDVAPPPAAPVVHGAPVVPQRLRHAAPERDREEQETQAVVAGMRALRLDHDPVRARGLLAQYLERHPNGALAEEALALTIEAAVAHHDGDAAALGARYLRRYPAGPFRALALRAQD